MQLPFPILNDLNSILFSHTSEKVKEYRLEQYLSQLEGETLSNAQTYVAKERQPNVKAPPPPTALQAPQPAIWEHPKLQFSDKGIIMTNPNNLFTILTEHPDFMSKLSFNELTHQPCYQGKPIEDLDYAQLRYDLSAKLRLTFKKSDVIDTAEMVAHTNKFHPIRDYLHGLKWDGKDRVGELCCLMRLEPNTLNLAVMRKWLVGAVARVQSPGCKVDTVLVLRGDTGMRKSSALTALCPEPDYFSSEPLDIGSKDSKQIVLGKWIIELAELSALSKKDTNQIKADITLTVDEFRSPYDRKPKKYPRQFIYVGTTNDLHFLSDPTSNRRFWVVEVQGVIDTDSLGLIRDQVWAQALALFQWGEDWWLNKNDEKAMSERAKAFEVVDPWTETVMTYLGDRDFVTTQEVLNVLVPNTTNQTGADRARIVKIMQFNKWRSGSKRVGTEKCAWGWHRPDGAPKELPVAVEQENAWN